MNKAISRADLIAVVELVNDTASQEWQETDGRRMAATDNSGNRMWFISDDVMQELKSVFKAAKSTESQGEVIKIAKPVSGRIQSRDCILRLQSADCIGGSNE